MVHISIHFSLNEYNFISKHLSIFRRVVSLTPGIVLRGGVSNLVAYHLVRFKSGSPLSTNTPVRMSV